jgi:hypothetical protein
MAFGKGILGSRGTYRKDFIILRLETGASGAASASGLVADIARCIPFDCRGVMSNGVRNNASLVYASGGEALGAKLKGCGELRLGCLLAPI